MPVVTERLIVRTTPEQRKRLERIVASSRLGNVSDHVRLALDEYIERYVADEERRHAEMMIAQT